MTTSDHAADTGLHVDISWTVADAKAFATVVLASQMAVVGRPKTHWSMVARVVVAVLAGGPVLALTHSAASASLASLVGVIAVIAGQWSTYFDNRVPNFVEVLHARDPDAYAPYKITLTQDALLDLREGRTARVELRTCKHVTRSEGIIFVWLNHSDAIGIPDRCFADSAAADAFVAALNARMAAAKL